MADIRQAFLSAMKPRFKDVQVPLIGTVKLRGVGSGEMREFKDSLTDDDGRRNERGKYVNELLVALCVVDDTGARAWTDQDAMSGAFGEIDSAAFAVLVRHCMEHTNFRADVNWSDVETAAKN